MHTILFISPNQTFIAIKIELISFKSRSLFYSLFGPFILNDNILLGKRLACKEDSVFVGQLWLSS